MADLTNKEFALRDGAFLKACQVAGVKATGRQASKWRNDQGLAFEINRYIKGGEFQHPAGIDVKEFKQRLNRVNK